jgi:molybdate transport system substrate-binding protein
MNRIIPVLMALASFMLAHVAPAAEITVLSAGAVEPGLKAAVAAFQKETGHTAKITFNTTPAILKRVGAGEVFDVVIAPPGAIKDFVAGGKVDDGGVNLGRVGSGIAVRPGAPVPDISSAEAVKRAVLEAESIVFNRASTGLYIENLLKKMGVYDQIEARTTRYPDAFPVMEHLLKGKGREIGFGPITEILLFKDKGLRLVGPLPAEIQNYTTYIAVSMSAGAQKDAAQALVRFLGGPVGKPLFVAAGIE